MLILNGTVTPYDALELRVQLREIPPMPPARRFEATGVRGVMVSHEGASRFYLLTHYQKDAFTPGGVFRYVVEGDEITVADFDAMLKPISLEEP